MIGNILKFIAAIIAVIIVSFIVGYLSGVSIGLMLGLGLRLFFPEIVFSHPILVSIILALIIGGLLGLFAVQIINKVTESNDNPLVWIAFGAVASVIVVIYVYGYIDISVVQYEYKVPFYTTPYFYSLSIGGRIGTIIFPIFGVVAVVREVIKSSIASRKMAERGIEHKNELSFYRSKNSEADRQEK